MPSNYGTDRFRKDGAEALARKVERYWRNLGHTVRTLVEPLTEPTAVTHLTQHAKYKAGEFYVVRSDLVNGLPRKKAMAKAA